MITLEEAKATIHFAFEHGLSGAEFLAALGLSNVARACNGIGPEKMPEKWCRKFDDWLWLFRIPCRGHDCRFTYDNDGTEAKFRAANDELERNCLIMADAMYAWYNPLRYLWRHRAHVMAWMCREFGWDAWRDAYKKAQEQGIVACAQKISGECPERGETVSKVG